MQIVQTQSEPRPLCVLITQLLASGRTAPSKLGGSTTSEPGLATADMPEPQRGPEVSKKQRRNDPEGDNALGVSSSVCDRKMIETGATPHRGNADQLPPEGLPLLSLAAFAAQVLTVKAARARSPVSKDKKRPRTSRESSKAGGAGAVALKGLLHMHPSRSVIEVCAVSRSCALQPCVTAYSGFMPA